MILQALAYIWLGWYALLWLLAALGLYVARTRYNGSSLKPRRSPSSDELNAEPGVSILRPLRGLDTNLYENLESSFLQDYSNFEIIFSVAEEGDAAIPIVQELMRKYSKIPARLIIGDVQEVVNPKIRNMLRSYRAAAFDILWVIDSNVLTSTSTLANSVALLTAPTAPGAKPIGLVHHLPFAIYPDANLGSRVEQAFLCSTHAKMYLAINWVAVASCVTGKSCLYRKSDLERAADKKRLSGRGHALSEGTDGLAAFGKYLGEDNMIGEAIWDDLGMRHAMGGDIAGNAVGSMQFSTYFRRRVRWIRVRKYMVIASTLIEPLTECFVAGLISCFVFARLYKIPRFLFLVAHVLAWYSVDVAIYKSLLRASPAHSTRTRPPAHDGPGGGLAYAKAWLVRESAALPIWIFAMCGGDTVGWRDAGQTLYRVRPDGTVALVDAADGGGVGAAAWGERALARVARMWSARRSGQYVTLRPDDVEEQPIRN